MGKYLLIVIVVSYSKLHSSIVCSSLWTQPDPVRILFVTLLAVADREGYVYGSKFGIARIANIKQDQIEESFSTLLSPDPFSCDLIRSPENEGRRLEEFSGGFRLLNYEYYRGLRDDDERREQNKQAQKRFREKRSQESATVSHSKPASATVSQRHKKISPAEAEAEAEAEENKTPLPPLEAKSQKPKVEKQSPSAQIELDPYSAALGLAEKIGVGNRGKIVNNLINAISQAERRWPGKDRFQVVDDIAALWKEYVSQGLHAPVAIHNWLDTLGSFIDSDHWRKKEKAPQAPKPQNGHKPANPTPEWAFRKPQ